MPSPREERLAAQTAEVAHVLAALQPLPIQLDDITRIRGHYNPDHAQDTLLTRYLTSPTPPSLLPSVISTLADPIDEAYTSGHASDEDDQHSCEAQLWTLWHAVLHSARKSPYLPSSFIKTSVLNPDGDPTPQTPLLQLISTLKSRADPPAPSPLPVELARDWIWENGKVWSSLALLGPSIREAWNDTPGAEGTGTTEVERWGWENVNGFVAGLARDGLAEVWNYGVYAFREALEEVDVTVREGEEVGTDEEIVDARVRAASAWVRVVGREIWEYAVENAEEDGGDGEVVAVDAKKEDLPWGKSVDYSRARWRFWREKFGVLEKRTQLLAETKEVAGEMAALMSQIEQEALE